MKRLIGIAVGMMLVAGLGCSGGDEGGNEETGPQLPVPLAVGNWWYSQNVSDSNLWDTTKVISDTVFDGHDAFVGGGITADSDTIVHDTLIAYYADSFLVIHKDMELDTTSTISVDMRIFKQDMAVGDTWTVFTYDTTMSGMPVNYRMWATVTGQGDTTVPAGSFNGCYIILDSMQVSISGTPVSIDTQIVWLAYGTGVVLTESSGDTSHLVSYHLE